MNIRSICTALLLLVLVVLPVRICLAQTATGEQAEVAQMEAQLLSSWWVSVESERGQRIMRVTRVGLRGDGNFALDIDYGILGGGQGPLKAALIRQGSPQTPGPQEWIGSKTFRIEFTTGAGTVISAESAGVGTFVGTFTPRSGRPKPITFERVSEVELQRRVTSANSGMRPAAERWLARDEIKIYYERGSFKSTFTVDMKGKTVAFYGSDDFCARGAIPADVRVDERSMLVFVFDPNRPGCPQLQYTFDPVSKAGTIRQRPGGSSPETPWGGPSGSKVSLVE